MPLRGGAGGRRLMANTILNFHFDYRHPSLSLKKALTGTEYRTANGFSRRYERQHRHGLQGEEGEHMMIRLILNDDPGFEEEDHHYLYDDVWKM